MEKKIIIWDWRMDNYVDMGWPCPKGFHVPTSTDRSELKSIMEWLWNTPWDDWRKKLHMPLVGYRNYSTSNTENKWSTWIYWSSHSIGSGQWYCFNINSSSAPNLTYLAYWYPIRWFKNFFEKPDSSWIVIQWTLWSAGIFADYTQWLISITWDWTIWYTIMDKNIWATEIYNDWDTLSEANCGYYFQWWNNYGFPFTWSVITSSTQVDASNYGPYYNNGWFGVWQSDWSRVDNRNLWWGVSWTVEAMQWPVPIWFHIPSKDENVALVNAMTTLGIDTSNWNCMKTYLKMPFAGSRNYSSADVHNQGVDGLYWSAGAYSTNYAYSLYFGSSALHSQNWSYRANGYPLRCFKNTSVTPNNSSYYSSEHKNWDVLYDWSSIAAGAWVFHNSEAWLISVSWDWVDWITIMDKNLWATQVYNDWDILSEENCWGYFQRWNNYMFPFIWNIATSSSQVDAINYWPYYNSNTFIIWNHNWSSVDNKNLWWKISIHTEIVSNIKDIWMWEWADDYSAMQGPCPDWFHVPSEDEWVNLCWILITTFWLAHTGVTMKTYLKMPFAGYRSRSSAGVDYQGAYGNYWSASAFGNVAHHLYFYSSTFIFRNYSNRTWGYSLRCFKNTSVAPDSSWAILYDWGSIAAWAWVFHNATEWLISVSWDWTTWYTIMDKNLWATTVYNDWDVLSEDNCWYYYQWWNNHGFSFIWAVITNNTQVDAIWYWPWNYYSSSTFIINNVNWSSTANDNLRWWEAWVQKKPNIKIYQWSTLVRWKRPWIYYNKKMWLISLSWDWFKRYTVQDKNLWATTVYNDGDVLSQANCGYYFQRWNNYGFPFAWSVTTSNVQVNTTWYWPWNYYYSSVFITGTGNDWASVDNKNLWWWETWTVEAMQWPASDWFHIPTNIEWDDICTIFKTLKLAPNRVISDWVALKAYLKLPYAGYRHRETANTIQQGIRWLYWTSKAEWTSKSYILYGEDLLIGDQGDARNFGLPLRCFRNTPIIPDDTWEMLY